ncbi:hypothetical protein IRT45_01325 [Nocardia sp. BSTN01]|uniref:hypothetical protein n=1 Tax=Nocardia sp. BSTN01 TaxID=2783665 RepID=UPI00188FA114|nr:hypothetical protein [Nocardia sp. BSTN01]MBF4995793.1 hypothetical protein [Nocardia sp. BSTN01]
MHLPDRTLGRPGDRRRRECGRVDLEFPAERDARGGSGDRSDRAADGIGGRARGEFTGSRPGLVDEPLGEAVGAELRAHRTADGARNAFGEQPFHFLAGESTALPLRHLQQTGARVDTGALRHTDDRGLGQRPGGNLLDQPLDDLADGQTRGDLRRRLLGRGGGRPDTRTRRGDRLDHLDREDHQGRDDDVFRMFDIGGGVVEVLAQSLDFLDQARPQAFVARDLIPELLDRLVRLAVDGGQGGSGDRSGIGLNFGQGVGELIPAVGEPPHRGLVTLRPITCADNIFRNPLQFGGDFDTHIRRRSELGLSDRTGVGLVLRLQRFGRGAHVARHTAEDGAEIAARRDGLTGGIDVPLRELLADFVVTPASALGLDDPLQVLHRGDHPVRDVVVPGLGRPQGGRICLERAHLSPRR